MKEIDCNQSADGVTEDGYVLPADGNKHQQKPEVITLINQ